MLQLNDAPFCTGRSDFLDASAAGQEATSKLFVRLRINDLETLAQLDTGAPWSIIMPEIAEALDLFNGEGPDAEISTRLGPVVGKLERIDVTLLASSGQSLDVEATVFVSREWNAGTFIGWNGLLERVRFAIDPRENAFYFGAA